MSLNYNGGVTNVYLLECRSSLTIFFKNKENQPKHKRILTLSKQLLNIQN